MKINNPALGWMVVSRMCFGLGPFRDGAGWNAGWNRISRSNTDKDK